MKTNHLAARRPLQGHRYTLACTDIAWAYQDHYRLLKIDPLGFNKKRTNGVFGVDITLQSNRVEMKNRLRPDFNLIVSRIIPCLVFVKYRILIKKA